MKNAMDSSLDHSHPHTMVRRSDTRTNTQSDIISSDMNNIIDFDAASKAWRANKICLPNGTYKYICGCLTRKGTLCKKSRLANSDTCYIHSKYSQ